VVLQVLTLGGGGAVATVGVVNVLRGSAVSIGGSYFTVQANPVAQSSTSGVGTGATFNLTQASTASDQRVILTNQEFAIGNYIKDIVDENVFDDDFVEALSLIVGARLCIALSGDKSLANSKIAEANAMITEARFFRNIQRYGNTSSASLLIAASEWQAANPTPPTSAIVFAAFGAGFNWGAIWPGFS